MRRGVCFLVIGVLLAALGAASAYAAGTTTVATTTTTSTTTTGTTATTTTGATTTTSAPTTYSRLIARYLPGGCVGAGAAAIVEPGRRALVLGTPASDRGPSTYPTKSPIVRFDSSAASGSACGSARVTLESVSLFGDVITAKSISARNGRGAVSFLEIDGSPVTLRAGHGVTVGGWGELTLEKTVGRLTAPLVLQLLQKHRSLPAGTTIALAFRASAQPVAEPKGKHQTSEGAPQTGTTEGRGPAKQHSGHVKQKHGRHKAKVAQPLTATPGLGFKASHYVFPVDGGASYVDTYGAGRSDIYDGWHHGDDLFAPLGTPVVAVSTGTLSLVGWNALGGWRLWLTDKKGNSFYYAHLAGYARSILTHRHVQAGQVLGFLGRTGDAFTTTPHLHFEIHPHEPFFVKLGYDGAVDPTRYLHLWKVEHVPANEIPPPARLKAPVGTPRQEAAVVWHQLLVARHLTPAKSTSSASSTAPSTNRPFPHPPSFLASGATPLAIAHVLPTAAQVPTSQSDLPVLVGGPVAGIVVLSAGAVAFLFRRRRKTAGGLSGTSLH